MLNTLSLEKFYNIIQFDQAHVHDWLAKYSIQNEEIHQALCNISIDFQELENDFFNIKIWNEINVAPMRSYIQEWIERQLKQAVDERQQGVIDDINETKTASK